MDFLVNFSIPSWFFSSSFRRRSSSLEFFPFIRSNSTNEMTTTNAKIDSVQLTPYGVPVILRAVALCGCDAGFPYLYEHSLKCVIRSEMKMRTIGDERKQWHKTYPQRWAQLFDKGGRARDDDAVAMVTRDGDGGGCAREFNQINCY